MLRRFRSGFRWESTALEAYKIGAQEQGGFKGVSRQFLAGARGEQIDFHVRYFELEPGGFTSLERHRHSHIVIPLRGRGRVRVDERYYSVSRFDTLYIGPNRLHQLSTVGRGRFGFLCVVDARRGTRSSRSARQDHI